MPVVAAFGVVQWIKHASHGDHEYHQTAYPFVKKRDKELPWALAGGSKCDLFDYACAEKEKAAKAALEN